MHPIPGPLLPLSPRVTLAQLLDRAGDGGICGVWMERGSRPAPGPKLKSVRVHDAAASVGLVIGSDLGALIRRVPRVLVRRAGRVVAIHSARLAELRCLEVAGGHDFPSLYDLSGTTPEAVLALQIAAGRAVAGSIVRYLG